MAGPADHWPPTVGAFWFHYWLEFWLQFWAASIAAQRGLSRRAAGREGWAQRCATAAAHRQGLKNGGSVFTRRSARRDPNASGLGADPCEVPPLFLSRSGSQNPLCGQRRRGFSAEQNTDTIVPFAINQAKRMLTPTGQVIKISSPCTIVFAGA